MLRSVEVEDWRRRHELRDRAHGVVALDGVENLKDQILTLLLIVLRRSLVAERIRREHIVFGVEVV